MRFITLLLILTISMLFSGEAAGPKKQDVDPLPKDVKEIPIKSETITGEWMASVKCGSALNIKVTVESDKAGNLTVKPGDKDLKITSKCKGKASIGFSLDDGHISWSCSDGKLYRYPEGTLVVIGDANYICESVRNVQTGEMSQRIERAGRFYLTRVGQ